MRVRFLYGVPDDAFFDVGRDLPVHANRTVTATPTGVPVVAAVGVPEDNAEFGMSIHEVLGLFDSESSE